MGVTLISGAVNKVQVMQAEIQRGVMAHDKQMSEDQVDMLIKVNSTTRLVEMRYGEEWFVGNEEVHLMGIKMICNKM